MIKRLTTIGNSLGIIIDRPILDLLNIGRDTELEVRTDGKGLIIQPVDSDRVQRVRSAAARVSEEHADAFEKLAK